MGVIHQQSPSDTTIPQQIFPITTHKKNPHLTQTAPAISNSKAMPGSKLILSVIPTVAESLQHDENIHSENSGTTVKTQEPKVESGSPVTRDTPNKAQSEIGGQEALDLIKKLTEIVMGEIERVHIDDDGSSDMVGLCLQFTGGAEKTGNVPRHLLPPGSIIRNPRMFNYPVKISKQYVDVDIADYSPAIESSTDEVYHFREYIQEEPRYPGIGSDGNSLNTIDDIYMLWQ